MTLGVLLLCARQFGAQLEDVKAEVEEQRRLEAERL
eukprot:SAG11_NODE_37385_length_257_cov_0.651899_1_plen_35_part_10